MDKIVVDSFEDAWLCLGGYPQDIGKGDYLAWVKQYVDTMKELGENEIRIYKSHLIVYGPSEMKAKYLPAYIPPKPRKVINANSN